MENFTEKREEEHVECDSTTIGIKSASLFNPAKSFVM
jgi:hypothetical protein